MKRKKYNYSIQLALEAFKSTGYLIVNKILIKKFGLVNASILSNYIDKYIYFSQKKDFDGSFYLRHEDIMYQLNIKEYTVRKAKKTFIELGIFYVEMKGSPAKEWVSIDFETLVSVGLALTKTKGLALTKTKGLIYKENKLKENKDNNIITALHFKKFWEIYPKQKKGSKGKALKAWNNICSKKDRPSWKEIKQAISEQSESDQWKVQKYIPAPTTWINQSRWLDDPSELKNYDKEFTKINKPRNAHSDGLERNWDD